MKKILTTLCCATWLLVPAFSVQAQNAPRDFDGPDRPDRGRFDGERGPGQRGRNGRGPMGRRGRDDAQFRLDRLWRGVGELENSATPLSKTQAARVVALMRPWSNRAQMSDADAQKLEGQLRALLTTAQKNALDERRFSGRQGGPDRGPRGDGEGRRSGRGPRGDGPPDGRRRKGRRGNGAPKGERLGGERLGGERLGGERLGGGPRGGGRREGRGAAFDPQKMAAGRSQLANPNPFYAPTGLKEWRTLPQPMQQRLVDRYKDNRAVLEALSRKSRG